MVRSGCFAFAVMFSAATAAMPTTQPAAAQSVESPAAKPGLEQLEFFLGEWRIVNYTPDGSRVVDEARTEVRYILDGSALQSDYYGLDRGGNAVFRGTTIRTWVPSKQRFAVHWALAGLPGYTYLEVAYQDGELIGSGHGFDPSGEFLEQYRYYNLSDEHYSFEMKRSYDGGETWVPYSNLRASRPEASVL